MTSIVGKNPQEMRKSSEIAIPIKSPRSTSIKVVKRKVEIQTKPSDIERLEKRIKSRNWEKIPRRETMMIEDKIA